MVNLHLYLYLSGCRYIFVAVFVLDSARCLSVVIGELSGCFWGVREGVYHRVNRFVLDWGVCCLGGCV